MTRPWRLTRRQRVEMEAALSGLRRDADARAESLASEDRAYDAAVVAGMPELSHPVIALSNGRDIPRAWRTLRVRVAIALRAALRADEDARCEEACAALLARYPDDYDHGEMRDSAVEFHDALREWPMLAGPTRDTGVRVSLASLYPLQARAGYPPEWDVPSIEVRAYALALWERTPRPSLWAQSPPTSDPRGPR